MARVILAASIALSVCGAVPPERQEGRGALPQLQGDNARHVVMPVMHYRVGIHNLSADGEPIWPTPTATPARAPTPVTRSVQDIICSYPWPCDYALRIARCESTLNPNAYNRTPVWLGGVEHHASGLFQLLMPLHAHRLNGASPFDAEANTRAAYGLWREQGWGPWRECW